MRSGTAAVLPLCIVMFFAGCEGDKNPVAPSPEVVTVTGTVRSSITGIPVRWAEVSIGNARAATTGEDGRFTLFSQAPLAATLRCQAAGYLDSEAKIEVKSGTATQDIQLTRIEIVPTRTDVYEFGDFALYMPTSPSGTLGLIVALGGPDTRGFATAKPMGAPTPEVEASLQLLGQSLRTLANTHGLAVLGTKRAAMPNGAESDQQQPQFTLAAEEESRGEKDGDTAHHF